MVAMPTLSKAKITLRAASESARIDGKYYADIIMSILDYEYNDTL